jgi:glycosyltransferase involved in cell wall biosynthesis
MDEHRRPIRVLHVSQPAEGGVAVYIAEIVADQRDRGWDVAVACPPGGDLADRCATVGVRWLAWDADRATGPRILIEARRLRRVVNEFSPDVVHLHSSKAGLVGRLVLWTRHKPTIFQPHAWSWLAATGPMAWLSLLWERVAARRVAALVCVGAGELWQGRRAGVHGPYRLVRNGVDRRRFTPAHATARRAARTRLRLPTDAPLAVCIGRLSRQKGQDTLVAAWREVIARCPRALLAIVGDGEDLSRLRRQSEEGILFIPAVADTRDWLAASNVVVLPSRWEGLPLTALEAIATGRPVVGTDIPGLAEVICPGSGALVPVDDTRALANELAGRLLAPGLADREGRAAAHLAGAFDMTETVAELAAVTTGLIDRAGGTDPDGLDPGGVRAGDRNVRLRTTLDRSGTNGDSAGIPIRRAGSSP